jgi:hypothetical protein
LKIGDSITMGVQPLWVLGVPENEPAMFWLVHGRRSAYYSVALALSTWVGSASQTHVAPDDPSGPALAIS